jgi:1-acyl-sn-glycerol-3-phosphate acyltransferase
MAFWIMLALSVFAGVGFLLGGVSLGLSLLYGLGVFVGLNLLFVVFWYIVALVAGSSGPVEEQSPICRQGCAIIAGWLCAWGRVHPKLSGTELLPMGGQRFLLICNHRGAFDPVVKASELRDWNISFLSKPENLALPGIGRLAWGAGFLAINRENDREALKAILKAADFLKRGVCSICLYPEGTRTKTGKLLPFHAGSFKIAQRGNAPVVIAAVQGTEQVKKNFHFRRTNVKLDILELIPAEKVKAMSTNELAEYCRGRIAAHLGETPDKEEQA